MGIDLRIRDQRINGWYIWNEKDRIKCGINGTSQHYSWLKKDYSLKEIKTFISLHVYGI